MTRALVAARAVPPSGSTSAASAAGSSTAASSPRGRRRAVQAVWAVARREVEAALGSPSTLALLGGAALFIGFVFVANFVDSRNSDPRTLFSNFGVVMLLVGPAVTMRSFSDEKQRGTLEHLLAAPVRNGELVLGKYLGACVVGALLLAATTLVPVFLSGTYGELDGGTLVARYVGSLVLVAAVVAVGIAASAVAANHFVSALASLLLLLALQYAGLAELNEGAWLARLVSDAGLTTHQDAYLAGALAWRDIVYFASLVVAGLLVAHWGVATARRRGWGQ